MLAIKFDSQRLISFSLHVGGALSEADMQEMVACIGGLSEGLKARKEAFATVVVVVETAHPPNATQRRRIAEASRKVERGYEAVVTPSVLARGVMTAIRWLIPRGKDYRQETFATFEEARAWLVARTGYPAALLDTMHEEARSEVGRRLRETQPK